MKRRTLKRLVVSLLQDEQLAEIYRQLSVFDQKSLVNPLVSCFCHGEEIVRWHSISAIGQVIKAIASEDVEAARVVMRRFLWMLNDESGGIGWGVPEAMSESMYQHDLLASEYMHMLVSYARSDGPELFQDGNFIELPLLQHGVLWGLCRLAEKYQEQLLEKNAHENLGFYLSSEDSMVRGLAARCCGLLKRAEFTSLLQGMSADQQPLRIYLDGTIQQFSVGTLAAGALSDIGS
ncbi:MAG: HEAT repeat domain-containing protein [Desulfocapsaceae bacterium]|jgi:hypothetical protein|nr:HEAT repeat domain-containing protein [Desulfocapsaceae bacterium]